MNKYKTPNDKTLADFQTIDSCIDINRICTKDWYISHVKIVHETKVNHRSH